jgi:hypothetical protein
MDLQIDANLCAYGLFQVAFAGLDTRLSRSVVALLSCKNTETAFAVVRRIPFGRRAEILQKAIKAATANSSLSPEIIELEEACKLAKDVSRWRNNSVHGEVRFNENRPVLVDEKGQPLQIDYETCLQKVREATRAGIAMQASVPNLAAYYMDLHDLMDEPS